MPSVVCLYEKAGLDPIVVQTHRSILASMSDSLQPAQGSAPEPEDGAPVKTVLVVDDVEISWGCQTTLRKKRIEEYGHGVSDVISEIPRNKD
jgi:hypothetical protein